MEAKEVADFVFKNKPTILELRIRFAISALKAKTIHIEGERFLSKNGSGIENYAHWLSGYIA